MVIEFSKFKEYYIQECQECGSCFKKCFAYKKTQFPIFKHIKNLFQHNSNKENIKRIKKFLNSCIYCKSCQISCVKGLLLTERLAAIKYELSKINSKYRWAPQNVPSFAAKILNPKRTILFFQNLLNELIPKEFRKRFEPHRRPQKREIVFFTGCGIQALENQFYSILDIFKLLNIDFGLIEGSYAKPICCGAIFFELGEFKYGSYLLQNLINEIKKFQTKKIVVYCATCYYSLKTLAPQLFKDYDLEIIHASGYIAQLLSKEAYNKLLIKPENKDQIITIHDSCHLAHSGDVSSIRNMLSLLPGVKISEMKHNKHNSICDASCLIRHLENPIKLLLKKDILPIIKEANNTKAKILCSLCPGCHAILSIFGDGVVSNFNLKKKSIIVKNWVSILGEYLEIKRKDMLSHRFTHFITAPFNESGLWYFWKIFKAYIRGYIGLKVPK